MNPAGLLKMVAALMPLIGNQELGQAIIRDITEMFRSMQRSADAMEAVNRNLLNISEQLEAMSLYLKMPVTEETINRLISYNGSAPSSSEEIIDG